MATRAGKGRAPARARKIAARIAIVRARWNEGITRKLEEGAVKAAAAAGARADLFTVAGSFELPAAVALLAETGTYDAVIPLGCLIRGETPHFDVLAHAVARALSELAITYPVAIPFGVLTCDTAAQARARAGGRQGNKGAEAVDAALELVALRQSLRGTSARRSSRSASTARSRSTQ